MQETLPISEAQSRHLNRLMEQQAIAEQAVKVFIAYLRDEHGVGPDNEWSKIDANVGFIREKKVAAPE